jgi:4-amino-4-deoxy-L-arabinose transferase-like glycosyltransferase
MLASVALCYVIASRLFGRVAGFFSAVILATNPLVLHHSQELRPYAMLMFASLLTTLLFLLAMESPSERRWAHWGIASGFAAFVQPFALFVSLAHVAIWVRQRSRAPWREVRWGVALLGASVVLLLTVIAITYDARIDWIDPLSITSLGKELRAVTGQSTGYALMANLLLVVVSIVVNRSKRPAIETVALWFLLPLVLAILISIVKPILIARYMIIMVPPLAILLGSLVARLKFPLAVVALAILCASVAPNYLDWISGSDQGLDDAIRTIAAHSKPGDVVITQPLTESALNYYMRRTATTETMPLLAPTLDAEIKQAEVDSAPRIWKAQWIGHPEPEFALPHDVVQSYSAIYGSTRLVLYVRR